MVKKLGGTSIIGAALVISAFIFGQAALAANFSYNDDPVPGGMCGCGSCNCIMVPAAEADTVTTRSVLMSLLSKKQVAAIAEGATLSEEKAIQASKTTTSSSNTQSNAGKTTNTQTSNTQSTAAKTTNTQTTSNTVSNTNKTTNTQSSSGPSESLVSSGGSSSSNNNKQESSNKTSNTQTSSNDSTKDTSSKTSTPSSNTQNTRNDNTVDSSTGKSSGSYNYSSDAGKIHVADNNPDYRSLFLDTTKANLVAPSVNKDSYYPYYSGSSVYPSTNPQYSPGAPLKDATNTFSKLGCPDKPAVGYRSEQTNSRCF